MAVKPLSMPGAFSAAWAVPTTTGALVDGAEAQALNSATMALTQTHCKLCFMKTLSLCDNEKNRLCRTKVIL